MHTGYKMHHSMEHLSISSLRPPVILDRHAWLGRGGGGGGEVSAVFPFSAKSRGPIEPNKVQTNTASRRAHAVLPYALRAFPALLMFGLGPTRDIYSDENGEIERCETRPSAVVTARGECVVRVRSLRDVASLALDGQSSTPDMRARNSAADAGARERQPTAIRLRSADAFTPAPLFSPATVLTRGRDNPHRPAFCRRGRRPRTSSQDLPRLCCTRQLPSFGQ